MAGYQRFVAYVYEYLKGKKGNNCGFIKVEVKEQRCRLELHLQCPGLPGQVECRVYGLVRNGGLMDGNLLGTCKTGEGTAQCLIETDAMDMSGTGVGLGKMGGLILITESGAFFGTEWDDIPIRPENFREVKKAVLETTTALYSRKEHGEKQSEVYGRKYSEEQKEREQEERDLEDQKMEVRSEEESKPEGDMKEAREKNRESYGTSGKEAVAIEEKADTWNEKQQEIPMDKADVQEEKGVQIETRPERENDGLIPELVSQSVNNPEMPENLDIEFRQEDRLNGSEVQEDFQEKEGSSEMGEQMDGRIDRNMGEMDMEGEKRIREGDEERTGFSRNDMAGNEKIDRNEKINRNEQMAGNKQMDGQNTWMNVNWQGAQQEGMYERAPQPPRLQPSRPRPEPPRPQPPRRPSQEKPGDTFSPFGDDEITDCRKIHIKDLARLNRKDVGLRNNRFLQYGYYNFGHLLICRRADGRYILGVPGGYDQQERFMANMFGFPFFKESRYIQLPKGRGGYWYRLINTPDFH